MSTQRKVSWRCVFAKKHYIYYIYYGKTGGERGEMVAKNFN